MTDRLAFLSEPHEVLEGPFDVGTEQRWRIRRADGTVALVGQLAPDLARDESIRRRYVRDVERLRDLGAPSLAPILQTGQQPNPRDPNAAAPWRMRLDSDGEPLSRWLARAPCPIDEVATVFAAVADAVHAVHAAGGVLRDLRPEQILRTPQGGIVLADVGLARVDVLSSHTASSLLLQGSSYAAPEQLLRTAVDQRSDLYSLGVMMWQALTGELPFGDGPALLTERRELPPLRDVRPDAPPVLDDLVRRCLAESPRERPPSVSEISWVLRGGAGTGLDHQDTTVCQHCGAPLRLGQRLCIDCGRVAVKFVHAGPGDRRYSVELVSMSEDAKPLRWLQEFIRDISRPPIPAPEFVIGSIHDYSEEERRDRIKLPARLYANVTRETATQLSELMNEHGLRTRVCKPDDARRAGFVTLAILATTLLGSLGLYLLGVNAAWLAVPGGVALLVALFRLMNRLSEQRATGRFQLRPIPAALPASDPLVARLSRLLEGDPPADVRAIVGELALLVQRLVDHRARFVSDTRELDALTAPIDPLVDAVVDHVQRLTAIGAELAGLDEGAMVRALAAAEARRGPATEREPLLAGLDRLRALEDQRAAIFHRLLEVELLLQRTVDLGLAVHDPAHEQDRQVQLALATLTQ